VLARLAILFIASAAAAAASDVIVYTDRALERALHDIADRFAAQSRVPVHRVATPPSIIFAQLRRSRGTTR
jgi:ABC-type molybdate transport system substrate-binding protein